MSSPFTHGGSRQNLIGKNADAATEARFDASQRVTPNTPPLFIVHAADDKVVPIENADLMIAAARKNKVPYAMVLLSHGGHGFGLGENPEAKMWIGNCLAWLRGQKLLD
jgi:dipeptidyl aminopeptidase/acylaminoacyl peptidase